MKTERCSYIDIYKGILILMVVLGHIVYIMRVVTGLALNSYPYEKTQYIASTWIAPYYMAAFFLATGYCSGFKRSLKKQIVIDAKRLVLPAIIIPLIMKIVTPPMKDFNWDVFSFIFHGELPWFLMAMFWARLFFKIIFSSNMKDVYKVLIFVITSIGGCWILKEYREYEYLSFFHGLIFSLFIYAGYKLRNIKINKFLIFPAIGIYWGIVMLCASNVPALCADIYFGIERWPIYLVAAFSGSLVFFLLSGFIGHNYILEFIGKRSLVIYLTHCEFLRVMSGYMRNYISDRSFLYSVCIILFMFVGATCWGVIWAKLFNLKYTKWILGL